MAKCKVYGIYKSRTVAHDRAKFIFTTLSTRSKVERVIKKRGTFRFRGSGKNIRRKTGWKVLTCGPREDLPRIRD